MEIKVLLVEDDDMARRRLKRVIEKEGYSVLIAPDGYEGLNIYKRERPDIVITDVKMPRVDGIEVMQRIKEMSTNTEIILITGHGDVDMAILALRQGALDYIKKPINIDQLIISLGRAKEKILERRKISIPNSILILEDDDKTRLKLGQIYEKEGYRVFTGCDGEEGVKIFSENKIDIILSDLRMPKMNGLEVVQEVKKISNDCEVIMLSGYGDETNAVEAMRSGAINFIRKPIDLEQLLLSTQKAMDKLNLQRAYGYKTRELELTNQILNKLASEKGQSIEIPENMGKHYFDFILDLINIMSIAYVLINKEMKVDFVNKHFSTYYTFFPDRIDKYFFERLGFTNINIEEFKRKVMEVFDSKDAKIVNMPAQENKQIIIVKVYQITNNIKQERVSIFIGGGN